jgi:anion-transporting  ArsA/GET3 family ATPase
VTEATTWVDVLDRYGIPLAILVVIGYTLYKFIIPSVVKQLEKQQEYYLNEINRLNNESREDRKVVMDLVKQNNETNAKLQITLENLSERIESTQRDVSVIYQMVAREKKLINGNKEHYGEKE